MYVILTLDNAGGMMFNHRRQSRDRVLLRHMLALAESLTSGGRGRLLMSPYTAGLFPGGLPEFSASSDDFLAKAAEGDVCFVEDAALAPYADRIRGLYAFRWNRDYPADRRLDIDLSDWDLSVAEEFPGSSHDRITLERYLPPAK